MYINLTFIHTQPEKEKAQKYAKLAIKKMNNKNPVVIAGSKLAEIAAYKALTRLNHHVKPPQYLLDFDGGTDLKPFWDVKTFFTNRGSAFPPSWLFNRTITAPRIVLCQTSYDLSHTAVLFELPRTDVVDLLKPSLKIKTKMALYEEDIQFLIPDKTKTKPDLKEVKPGVVKRRKPNA